MRSASTAFHLLGALRRAIGRVILYFFVFLIVSGLVVEVVAYFIAGRPAGYQPLTLTHIAAVAIGVTLGYAAALTVLVGEVIRFVLSTVQTVEKDVQGELSGGAKIVEGVVKSVEHRL